MRTPAIVFFSVLLSAGGAASDALGARGAKPCPSQGDAKKRTLQDLNEKRARLDEPSEDDIDDTVTMEELMEPGDDRLRWQDGQAVEITAYVIEVKDGGAASSNCHATDSSEHDTILELAPTPNALDFAHRLFAVVTPQWRKLMAGDRIDWSTRALRARYVQRWVTVSGWLLFNFEAASQAANTASLPGPNVTRATAWEIHPATSIELNDDVLEQQAILSPPSPVPADAHRQKEF